MDEQQFMALIEQIGPEALLMLIDMLTQLSPEQIQALQEQLAAMVQQGGQGQQQAAPDQGTQNIYG